MAGTILRLPRVASLTGLSKATIYRAMEDGRFPRSIEISKRARGWLEEEIDAWKAERCAQRDVKEAV